MFGPSLCTRDVQCKACHAEADSVHITMKTLPLPPSLVQVYPVHGGMEDWAYAASRDKAYGP